MSGSDKPFTNPPPPPKGRSTWQIIGSIVAFAAVVCGVAIVAFFILGLMAFSSYGSSK